MSQKYNFEEGFRTNSGNITTPSRNVFQCYNNNLTVNMALSVCGNVQLGYMRARLATTRVASRLGQSVLMFIYPLPC